MTLAFAAPALDPRVPRAAFAPDAPVKVGVLVNPNARTLRGRVGDRLSEVSAWAPGGAVAVTQDLGEAAAALDDLQRAGVNVLAVAGGDGTLHHAIQHLTRWPGTIVAVPDGTLNIVARGQRHPEEVLRGLAGRTFGDVRQREARLLRVTSSAGVKLGFVFGSEMVKNALELYDRFGGGYAGLSRFLVEVGRGYLFKTELWKAESWRLSPPRHGARVDGGDVVSYSAIIAATCELAVAGGALRALSASDHGFSARVVTETRVGPLLKMIPALMREGDVAGVREHKGARRIELAGAFTLDGETYGDSSRDGAHGRPVVVDEGGMVRFAS